jgi:hypothetical protein
VIIPSKTKNDLDEAGYLEDTGVVNTKTSILWELLLKLLHLFSWTLWLGS